MTNKPHHATRWARLLVDQSSLVCGCVCFALCRNSEAASNASRSSIRSSGVGSSGIIRRDTERQRRAISPCAVYSEDSISLATLAGTTASPVIQSVVFVAFSVIGVFIGSVEGLSPPLVGLCSCFEVVFDFLVKELVDVLRLPHHHLEDEFHGALGCECGVVVLCRRVVGEDDFTELLNFGLGGRGHARILRIAYRITSFYFTHCVFIFAG